MAEAALAAGAGMINDVSGLRDARLAEVCAQAGAALVLMHTRVEPKGTLLEPDAYDDVVADVVGFLRERMAVAVAAGVGEEQIVLDPGPDFAKTPAQTVAVLRRLDALRALGRPLLLAVSRKDFLGAITGRGPRERGAATLAALGVRRARGGEHPARPRRRRGGGLPRRAGGARGRARAGARRGAHSRPLSGSLAFAGPGCRPLSQRGRVPTDPYRRERPMSSVLDRSALAESPLADLHLLANELGVDGFRRLRKDDLIDAILTKQAGDDLARPEGGDAGGGDDDDEAPSRSRRGRRGGRSRARDDGDEDGRRREARRQARPVGPRRSSPRRTRRSRASIELLGNGSAFVRLTEGETSDDDVYVSAAQVKRCELVSGDKVAGPMRPPRRSERFPSLVRVDTINGKPADEVSEGTRFDDLPVAFPAERLELGSEDPTVKAIEWLTPFGKGSRVTVVGPARAGKSEALRRIAAALAEKGGVELTVVLAGVRPEEVPEWQSGPAVPAAAVTLRRLRRRAGPGRRARRRAGPPGRRPRRRRGRDRRLARVRLPGRRAPRAGRGAQHRRRRLADRDRRRPRRRWAARRP